VVLFLLVVTIILVHLIALLLLLISSCSCFYSSCHISFNFHLVTFCCVMSCFYLFHCTFIHFFAFMFLQGYQKWHYVPILHWSSIDIHPNVSVSFFKSNIGILFWWWFFFWTSFGNQFFFDHFMFWSSSQAFEKNWSSLKQNF